MDFLKFFASIGIGITKNNNEYVTQTAKIIKSDANALKILNYKNTILATQLIINDVKETIDNIH